MYVARYDAEMPTPTRLTAVIGRALKQFREEGHLRQDDVAALARSWGLLLTRAMVARIESGDRELSIHEFVLLTAALNITPGELINTDDLIELSPTASAPSSEVLKQLAGTSSYQRRVAGFRFPERAALASAVLGHAELFPEDHLDAADDGREAQIRRIAGREAERQVAATLGITPEDLTRQATALWEGGLTEERDRRVARRIGSSTTKRSAATLRGHVTRELIDELRAHDNEAGQ